MPILDPHALLERLRYVFAHGYKEGLVGRPQEWRGVHTIGAWCHGKRLIGTWFDRTALFRDRKAGVQLEASHYESEHELVLSPPPGWEAASKAELREGMRRLVQEAIKRHRPSRPFRGRPRPRHAARRKDPHVRPARVSRRPAPVCHTTRRSHRLAYLQAYTLYAETLRGAGLASVPGREREAYQGSVPIGTFSTLQARL